jgi:hypothetical protein
MFPHPCSDDLEQAVQNGADPLQVVPDNWVVVRGGLKPIPSVGTIVSAVVGPDQSAAGCAVPHGNIRWTTAGAIRAAGGSVVWVPETSPHGTINHQHVNVVEVGRTSFSEPVPNPIRRTDRIDRGV